MGIEDVFTEYGASETDKVKLERTASKHKAALVKREQVIELDRLYEICLTKMQEEG